jgi:hypothetical protein
MPHAYITAHVLLRLQAHWPVPQQVAPGLPLQRFLFSQLPSLLLPPYYTAPASQQGLAKLSAPLRRGLWRWLQRSIVQQCGLQEGLLPSLPLQQDMLFYGQVADAQWSSILQQQKQDGTLPAAATAAAAAALGIVGASVSTAALSSMLCLAPSAAAVCNNASTSEERASCAQQRRSLVGSGSKASKPLLCGFLRGRCTAAPANSSSSTLASSTASRDGRSIPCTQNQGTSHSGDAQAREGSGIYSRDNSSSCASGRGNGGSSSSSCAVVPLFGEIERLGKDCLLLRSGGAVGADVVLYCTGYNRSYEFLDEVLKVRHCAACAACLTQCASEQHGV